MILGIDPGSVRVGFGAIESQKNKLTHIKSGLLEIPKNEKKTNQLIALQRSLSMLIKEIKPDKIGVEKLFFVKNQKTALEVAQARGVIMYTIAENQIPTTEISPREVKQIVTGDGNASKQSVAKMVRYFLKMRDTQKIIDDVSDALAIAIATASLRSNE